MGTGERLRGDLAEVVAECQHMSHSVTFGAEVPFVLRTGWGPERRHCHLESPLAQCLSLGWVVRKEPDVRDADIGQDCDGCPVLASVDG